MTKSLKQLEEILDVIGLKRQRLEADMALCRRQDAKLWEQIQAMSTPLEPAADDTDNPLLFALAATKWADWRDVKKHALQKQRTDLAVVINEIGKNLKRLTVQMNALEAQRVVEQKQHKMRRANQQAEARLDTWINTQ